MKNVLYFLSGVVVGAAAAGIALQRYYQAVSAKEVEEVVAYYDRTYRSKTSSNGKTEASEKTMQMAKKNAEKKEQQLVESVQVVETPTTNYADIYDKVKGGEIVPDEDAPEEDEERQPYLITDEEYVAVLPPYEKIDVIYNKDEHCLVDRATEEELDISKCIGMTVYDLIEDKIKGGTHLYVRNVQFGADYEIEVIEEG